MSKTINKKRAIQNKYKLIFLILSITFFILRSIQMVYEVSAELAYPGATLYLLDFNFYIGSRTFIGSILTLLTSHITYQQIFGLNLFIYISLVVAFAFLLSHTAQKAITEKNNILFLILLAFITFPYSLLQYANWISAYDLYLCLFALLSALTALSKRAHWLFPLFCIMAVFTHYSFVFAYFPAALSVHIYCITTSENKKSRIISTAAAFLSSFVSAVYCVFFANCTIKMTRDELFAYMENRLGMPVGNERYIDAYYFNEDVAGMLDSLQKQINIQGFTKNFLLFFLPTMLFFCFIWLYCITKTKKKQIFPLLCFLGTGILNILLVFIIQEYPRWLTAATLSQFIIFFVVIKKEDYYIYDLLKRLNKADSDIWFLIYVVFAILGSLTIIPYNAL